MVMAYVIMDVITDDDNRDEYNIVKIFLDKDKADMFLKEVEQQENALTNWVEKKNAFVTAEIQKMLSSYGDGVKPIQPKLAKVPTFNFATIPVDRHAMLIERQKEITKTNAQALDDYANKMKQFVLWKQAEKTLDYKTLEHKFKQLNPAPAQIPYTLLVLKEHEITD
jgi:hypothetical protein